MHDLKMFRQKKL